LAERLLPKHKVAGSKPVSRSTSPFGYQPTIASGSSLVYVAVDSFSEGHTVRWPTFCGPDRGVVFGATVPFLGAATGEVAMPRQHITEPDQPGPEEAAKRGTPEPADPEDDAEGHVRGRGITPDDLETKPDPDEGLKRI
jgi:hypothetical protein